METPRRLRLDLNEPAELAIYNALQEVEKIGADVRLTKAVTLLSEAKNLVADYVDSIDDKSSLQNEIIYVYWKDGRIEQMSRKRYKYQNVSLNPNIFFWSNEKEDPEWRYIEGEWRYLGPVETSTFCESCGSRNCIC